ncbi:hypothetical protein BKA81DRAFT_364647 [Phyllosticta paracitricarpa]
MKSRRISLADETRVYASVPATDCKELIPSITWPPSFVRSPTPQDQITAATPFSAYALARPSLRLTDASSFGPRKRIIAVGSAPPRLSKASGTSLARISRMRRRAGRVSCIDSPSCLPNTRTHPSTHVSTAARVSMPSIYAVLPSVVCVAYYGLLEGDCLYTRVCCEIR